MINKDIRICLHPYLYETDLQGSVRVVTDAVADSLVQSMEYLPDGTVFRAEGYPRQAYRYGGKEEMSLHGWNMYDSKARWQYARLPRFSTLDPLAEKYYHVSPYAYCGNDFVNFVDPSGEDHIFNSNGKLIKKTRHGNNIYIQTKDSKVLLSDLNMALKENRQIAANVIGYYAKGLGISYYAKGGIGVGNNPRGTIGLKHYGNKTVLAYNIGDNIYINYTTNINPLLSNYNNLKSTLIHENAHKDAPIKYNNNDWRHSYIYKSEIENNNFNKTTDKYKEEILGKLAEFLTKGLKDMDSYKQSENLILELNKVLSRYNMKFEVNLYSNPSQNVVKFVKY